MKGILVLVALAACCTKSKPGPKLPEPVVIVEGNCLEAGPPKDEAGKLQLAKPDGCPDLFATCLVRAQLIQIAKLARDRNRLRRWSRDAMTKCGPLPAEETPDGGSPQ